MGAMVNSEGWMECVAWPTMRARGACPPNASSPATTKAEAPSEIELALAAVIVPSLANAGRNEGIRSTRARRGCSSSATSPSGAISVPSAPSSMAASALVSEPMAKASISSRVT